MGAVQWDLGKLEEERVVFIILVLLLQQPRFLFRLLQGLIDRYLLWEMNYNEFPAANSFATICHLQPPSTFSPEVFDGFSKTCLDTVENGMLTRWAPRSQFA